MNYPLFCKTCRVWFAPRGIHLTCPACRLLGSTQEDTKRVVLWLDNRVFLLEDVHRNSDGWITRATVVNGYWSLIFEPQNWLAYAQGTRALLEKWPVKVYQELAVPSGMSGDYNAILAWAEGVTE